MRRPYMAEQSMVLCVAAACKRACQLVYQKILFTLKGTTRSKEESHCCKQITGQKLQCQLF